MNRSWKVSPRLRDTCLSLAHGMEWLERLPETVRVLAHRWSLELGRPIESNEASCSWVAPVIRPDGMPAVLKIGVPHFEAAHEIDGLRFWNGDPTVRLLESDVELHAMLLERCEPGTALRELPEEDQDRVLAPLLRRLWRSPPRRHGFRPLAAQMNYWTAEARARAERWPDAALVEAGLSLFQELPRSAPTEAVLGTDVHAGNILRSRREPWLVIDPKPFVGDPAYDATQHLLNSASRLRADADGTIRRFADFLEVDHERVRLWTFARAAVATADAQPRDEAIALARALAP